MKEQSIGELIEKIDPTLNRFAQGELALLADGLGVDLVVVHRSEMEIAMRCFAAGGTTWPRLQPLRHPLATFCLWRSVRQKWRSSATACRG